MAGSTGAARGTKSDELTCHSPRSDDKSGMRGSKDTPKQKEEANKENDQQHDDEDFQDFLLSGLQKMAAASSLRPEARSLLTLALRPGSLAEKFTPAAKRAKIWSTESLSDSPAETLDASAKLDGSQSETLDASQALDGSQAWMLDARQSQDGSQAETLDGRQAWTLEQDRIKEDSVEVVDPIEPVDSM